ncbi:aluminum induced protein with YGL and LRDR motifs [Actinidia rufa]|uniref:Aluminum induced protein with YGL and LRDR motifs n=1 Tax=Actinidia rufa TaxID=165716 RepID=A0A7J0GTJ9_9ERIC|nr:aluminum induced protein with YGL and LRDR motifs [Actinidia rufa]
MLGVFSSSIVSPPEELVAAGCRTPSPKITATALVDRFLQTNPSGVSVHIGDHVELAYTHHNESPLRPSSMGWPSQRMRVVLVIEAYKALRDRAPYPPNHVVGHLVGNFAFIVFDKSTSTLFVAADQFGKVPLYWGITADGYVAFANDADLLKGACGKSLASFPQGCFYSHNIWRTEKLRESKEQDHCCSCH